MLRLSKKINEKKLKFSTSETQITTKKPIFITSNVAKTPYLILNLLKYSKN